MVTWHHHLSGCRCPAGGWRHVTHPRGAVFKSRLKKVVLTKSNKSNSNSNSRSTQLNQTKPNSNQTKPNQIPPKPNQTQPKQKKRSKLNCCLGQPNQTKLNFKKLLSLIYSIWFYFLKRVVRGFYFKSDTAAPLHRGSLPNRSVRHHPKPFLKIHK